MQNKVLINSYYELAFEFLFTNNIKDLEHYLYILWSYDEDFDIIADTLKLSRNEVGLYIIRYMHKMFD